MATDRTKRHLATMTRIDLTESITYRPTGGTERSIYAVVDRQLPSTVPGSPAPVRAHRWEVSVVNDATAGIAMSTLNLQLDKIDIADRSGGTAAARSIVAILEQDSEWLKLGVS